MESCPNGANLMVSFHNFNQVVMKYTPSLQQTGSGQDGPGAVRLCSEQTAL